MSKHTRDGLRDSTLSRVRARAERHARNRAEHIAKHMEWVRSHRKPRIQAQLVRDADAKPDDTGKM